MEPFLRIPAQQSVYRNAKKIRQQRERLRVWLPGAVFPLADGVLLNAQRFPQSCLAQPPLLAQRLHPFHANDLLLCRRFL